MVQFREATINDINSIALLHAESWRKHYRGIWSDNFLDNDVYKERMDVWQQRLSKPEQNQYVLLAEKECELCGFACIYSDDDTLFGTLLDNLHVSGKEQGLGIGTQLMKQVAKKINARQQTTNFYLWVLEENYPAREFYERLGGKNYETISMEDPDGGFSNTCRYIWTNASDLIKII
jgi:ribosomal protein S18 acetylase RimI-like enzyme